MGPVILCPSGGLGDAFNPPQHMRQTRYMRQTCKEPSKPFASQVEAEFKRVAPAAHKAANVFPDFLVAIADKTPTLMPMAKGKAKPKKGD